MDIKHGVRGIVFDKDGTLFDYRTTWESWAVEVLTKLAGGHPEKIASLAALIDFDVMTNQLSPHSIAVAGTPEEIATALLPGLPGLTSHDIYTLLNEEAAQAPQAAATALLPLLTALRGAGLKLGVATNDAEMPARAHLEQASILDQFDFVAGSDSGYGAKPDPGQLLAFCDRVALAPESVLMVGDSLHDLMAGRAAGMLPVGVLTGLATREDLALHATTVLPHIGHLPGWLGLNS